MSTASTTPMTDWQRQRRTALGVAQHRLVVGASKRRPPIGSAEWKESNAGALLPAAAREKTSRLSKSSTCFVARADDVPFNGLFSIHCVAAVGTVDNGRALASLRTRTRATSSAAPGLSQETHWLRDRPARYNDAKLVLFSEQQRNRDAGWPARLREDRQRVRVLAKQPAATKYEIALGQHRKQVSELPRTPNFAGVSSPNSAHGSGAQCDIHSKPVYAEDVVASRNWAAAVRVQAFVRGAIVRRAVAWVRRTKSQSSTRELQSAAVRKVEQFHADLERTRERQQGRRDAAARKKQQKEQRARAARKWKDRVRAEMEERHATAQKLAKRVQLHGFERLEYWKEIARRDRALLLAQTSGKAVSLSTSNTKASRGVNRGAPRSPQSNSLASTDPSRLDRVWDGYVCRVGKRNERRRAARDAERKVENAEAGWGKRSRFPPLHGRTGDFQLKQFLSHMKHKWVHHV